MTPETYVGRAAVRMNVCARCHTRDVNESREAAHCIVALDYSGDLRTASTVREMFSATFIEHKDIPTTVSSNSLGFFMEETVLEGADLCSNCSPRRFKRLYDWKLGRIPERSLGEIREHTIFLTSVMVGN